MTKKHPKDYTHHVHCGDSHEVGQNVETSFYWTLILQENSKKNVNERLLPLNPC